jgi:pimeloyl-ACP methyl ester carboxylesterase
MAGNHAWNQAEFARGECAGYHRFSDSNRAIVVPAVFPMMDALRTIGPGARSQRHQRPTFSTPISHLSPALVWLVLGVGPLVAQERPPLVEPRPSLLRRFEAELTARSAMIRDNFDFGWTDLAVRSSHRLQVHADGRLHRLLDAKERTIAWGSHPRLKPLLEDLADSTESRGPERRLKAGPDGDPAAAPPRDLVILVHGLGRTKTQMARFEQAAREHGYDALSFGYASRHVSVERAGAALLELIRDCDRARKVHLVGFSMGGLVIRSALADGPDPRVVRAVLIGTPNRGSEHADWWRRFPWLAGFVGPAAWRLGTGPDGVAAQLPPPRVPFAVIAGARGNGSGWSATIPGDDDLLVGVHSALMPGAAASSVLRATHPGLLRSERTMRLTLGFLRAGRFEDPSPSGGKGS